jgi:DNA-binding IscR family transcriptional regulator
VQNPSTCSFGNNCPLHSVFCEAQAELVEKLRQSTFDKLLAKDSA